MSIREISIEDQDELAKLRAQLAEEKKLRSDAEKKNEILSNELFSNSRLPNESTLQSIDRRIQELGNYSSREQKQQLLDNVKKEMIYNMGLKNNNVLMRVIFAEHFCHKKINFYHLHSRLLVNLGLPPMNPVLHLTLKADMHAPVDFVILVQIATSNAQEVIGIL